MFPTISSTIEEQFAFKFVVAALIIKIAKIYMCLTCVLYKTDPRRLRRNKQSKTQNVNKSLERKVISLIMALGGSFNINNS